MKLKGGYPAVAAIIGPLFIFILAIGMKAGLILYSEIKQQQEQQILEEMWLVDDFYRYKSAGEILDGD